MKKLLLFALMASTILSQNIDACTVISYALKGEVYAAANEDDYMGFARVWFNPKTADRYGSVCFGLPDMQAQAAINEHGLFYDFTAQNIDPNQFHFKNVFSGDLFFEILGKCKTVPEAMVYLDKYDYTASAQILIADALGNSIIINAGTKLAKSGAYQINTNFDISKLKTKSYLCRRYDISDEALRKATVLNVPLFRDVLNRTRQEGKLSTIYSNIYDLKRKIITVYNFHDFEHPWVIDLKKELAKGYRLEKLSNRFPTSFAYEQFLMSDKAMYRKEAILDEINTKGLQPTLNNYFDLGRNTEKKDSTLNSILLEVGIQLVKESYNQYANGGLWEYWFEMPGGFKIENINDKRIRAAGEIFNYLKTEKGIDNKLQHFIFELSAYVNLVQGDRNRAKEYYSIASASSTDTWPISFNRSKKMLAIL
ncbi:hypothetical protein [Pedobacter sp. UBA5917]|jgi:hypothetical protein|uniref:hypothetical protein n=1 Tax=Pedobacter sp. UBA5917 TaxID=1947061 RepID=UPI0025DCB068|nr:hypothetical protein [Pedobacter sp. UBA5917]